jgi:hypothetical protein
LRPQWDFCSPVLQTIRLPGVIISALSQLPFDKLELRSFRRTGGIASPGILRNPSDRVRDAALSPLDKFRGL